MSRLDLNAPRGFTLVEILISLSIAAVIMTLLYGTFRTTMESAEAVDQQADSYRRARVVFYQLTKDLSMVFQKDQPANRQGEEPPFGSLLLTGEDRVRLIDGGGYPNDTIAFASLSYQPAFKGLPISGTAEITYSLSEEVLLRDARFLEKRVQNEVGDSVLGFNLRYFDGEEQEWLNGWSAPSSIGTLPANLPRAIEIELILKESQSPSVRLPLGTPAARIFAPVGAVLERRFKTIVEIFAAGVL